VTARLVAGCDGRGSSVRKWAGFEQVQDPDRLQISGLFLEDVPAPQETLTFAVDPGSGVGAVLFPQADGRARSYMVTRRAEGQRFSGERDTAAYLGLMTRHLPGEGALLKGARPAGPLATFNGADCFVPEPYRDGVALVGDAAAMSDPSWGQGLSMTVRDVRVLRGALLANDDWDAAGRQYAQQHQRDFASVRSCEDWFTKIFYETGEEAEARRGRALPAIAQEPDRVPDTMQSGPDAVPATEEARRRFFNED
jgi:2-polyprenyl-6-methoxyphenol hydroxylase-like FAD-dependent oxidoreductase